MSDDKDRLLAKFELCRKDLNKANRQLTDAWSQCGEQQKLIVELEAEVRRLRVAHCEASDQLTSAWEDIAMQNERIVKLEAAPEEVQQHPQWKAFKRLERERDTLQARIDKALELTGCDHDSRHDDVCQICAIRAALTDERQGDE